MPKTLFSFFAFIILSLSIVSPVSGQTVIQMEKDGGVYKIPCEINGLRLKLIFDTGASNVCISESIALMMLENGYLEKEDIKGSGSSIVADGRIVDNTHINIKSLKIGELTLNNVEAVVIHQQSAPLLLGQSAIQELGLVSIDGDKLILNQHNSGRDNITHYTDDEIAEMVRSASEAWDKDYLELAASIYKRLYNIQALDLEGKLRYATSLRMIRENKDALVIYKEIEDEVKSSNIKKQNWAYYGMMACFYELGDYDNCIIYAQLSMMMTDQYDYNKINFDAHLSLIHCLTMSFGKKGEYHKAEMVLKTETDKYLAFKKYKATDCWIKKSKDDILGRYYWMLANHYSYIGRDLDSNRYGIISAAWGYSVAIDWADNNNIDYSKKPAKYAY